MTGSSTQKFRTKVPVVSDALASDEQRRILDETKSNLGFVPNMYRGMAAMPSLLGCSRLHLPNTKLEWLIAKVLSVNPEGDRMRASIVFTGCDRANGMAPCRTQLFTRL